MIRVLIDTDIHIDFLKNIEASKKIFQGVVDEKVTGFSSVITEAELFSGKECNDVEKRIAVEELLAVTERITVNSFILRKSAAFRDIKEFTVILSVTARSSSTAILFSTSLHSLPEKSSASVITDENPVTFSSTTP